MKTIQAILTILMLAAMPVSAAGPYYHSAIVYWTAPGDDGGIGQASYYEIRYATFPILETNWDSCSIASNPPIPQVAGTPEQYTLTGLESGATYYVGIKTADEFFNWSEVSNVVSLTTEPDTEPPGGITDLRLDP